MKERTPWTRDELDAKLRVLDRRMAETEVDYPGARPLPPMGREECLDYVDRILDAAEASPLTRDDRFLVGQLLSSLTMAVEAEALGWKGRYYVVAEDRIAAIIDRGE